MDENFREDLRKETVDVYEALEKYLRGDSNALQLTGKDGIEGVYGIEHRTLKFMIMQKAADNPTWRELYINRYERNNGKERRNPEYSDIANMILLGKSIRNYATDYLNIPYETFKTFIKKLKADEKVPIDIKELLERRNQEFQKRQIFPLTEEERKYLIEFINRCEKGEFDSKKKTSEKIAKEANNYIGKINPDTGKVYTMKEIATKLGMGESTLRRHLQRYNMRAKMESEGGAK